MKSQRLLRLALLGVLVLGFSGLSFGQVYGQVGFGGIGINVAIGVAPPPLPVYDQPPIPEAGYIWTPGYWAWDDDDGYYWVPGTWVQPPEVGMVWTPGYWGWNDGMYGWNGGYWGTEVGFYGGIDYGFGYPGNGFYGGEWRGNQFYYNREVTNVTNVTNITTVYTKTVPAHATAEHVSFSGGQGGVQAQPTQDQVRARQTAKVRDTPAQNQQVQAAKSNPQTHAKNNGGKPAVAATAKPGDFSHAVQAKAAGGKVDQKSLQANAKTAPVKHNNAPNAAGKTTESGKANAAGKADENAAAENGKAKESGKASENAASKNERNVPKPPNAGADNGSRARATEPSTPKPDKSKEGNAAGMPQSENAGHHAAAEPSKPASHEAAKPEKSTPSKEAAPKPEKSNEKQKPDNKDENPK